MHSSRTAFSGQAVGSSRCSANSLLSRSLGHATGASIRRAWIWRSIKRLSTPIACRFARFHGIQSGQLAGQYISALPATALFEFDLAAVQDRFVPIDKVLSDKWSPLWDALLGSDGADAMDVLESHLAGRWQALQGRASAQPSLRQLGRHLVERLVWQAQEWRRVHSPRHVERRIKSFSGRSLCEWQALVRTEGLFFAARDRYESGQPFDWAALAQDEGFADQAHMSRAAKRITGFSPGEFAQRFIEDESFWMYRLWV